MRICANYIIQDSQNLTGWKYPPNSMTNNTVIIQILYPLNVYL